MRVTTMYVPDVKFAGFLSRILLAGFRTPDSKIMFAIGRHSQMVH